MPLFVNLSLEQRKNLFITIKSQVGKWDNFYPNYKISRAMFFNYLSGKYDLPINLFNIWKEIANFRDEVRIIEKKVYLKKEIKNISLDQDLSEIIGVLNGGGHISKSKKEICIVGSKHEKTYALYLNDLFRNKLGVDFHLFIYKNYFNHPQEIRSL